MLLIGCWCAAPSEVAISQSDHCPFAAIINGPAISLNFNQFSFWIVLFFILDKRGKCSRSGCLPSPWQLLFSLGSPLETLCTCRPCRRPAPPFIRERLILADIPAEPSPVCDQPCEGQRCSGMGRAETGWGRGELWHQIDFSDWGHWYVLGLPVKIQDCHLNLNCTYMTHSHGTYTKFFHWLSEIPT